MSESNTTRAPVSVECIIPILSVKSLSASIGFYTDLLGFKVDWRTITMASLSRDGRAIMLCEGGQGRAGTWVWIGVADIEPLYADYSAKGAIVRQKPTNFSWGYEMRIEDPDGHMLRFGSESKSDRPFE